LELRNLYAKFHINRLSLVKDEKIKFECSSIEKIEGVEFYVSDDLSEVTARVPMKDVTLEDMIKIKDERTGSPLLSATFTKNSPKPKLDLVIPSYWLDFLDTFELPEWNKDTYFVDYLGLVREKITKSAGSISLRREIIKELNSLLNLTIAEWDKQYHTYCSWLVNVGNTPAIVSITFSKIPSTAPKIVFQSLTATAKNSKKFHSLKHDCPWSPRWTSKEAAQRFKSIIEQAVGSFLKS